MPNRQIQKIEEAAESEINTNEEIEEYTNINELEQEEIVEENTQDTVENKKKYKYKKQFQKLKSLLYKGKLWSTSCNNI